jgi:hypothetical protein
MTKRGKHTTTTEDPNKLIDIEVKLPHWYNQGSTSTSFSDWNIRKQLKEIFEPGCTYTFCRTVVNSEAAQLLDNNQKRLVKERYDSDNLDHYNVRFRSDGLMEAYLVALDKVCKEHTVPHIRFPLIKREGRQFGGEFPDQVHWPMIHVVRGEENLALFKQYLGNFNSDEIQVIIAERESPQNYNMAPINLIKENSVNPLLLEERVWTVGSDLLRDAVDFLVQAKLESKHRGPTIYVDD